MGNDVIAMVNKLMDLGIKPLSKLKVTLEEGLNGVVAGLVKVLSGIPQHVYIRAAAYANPDRLAVVDIPHNKKETIGELWVRTNRLANALTDLGIKKGDHLVCFSDDCPEVVEMMFACSKIGVVWTVANARYVGHELEYIIDHSDSKVVLSGPGRFTETVSSIRPNLKKVEHYIAWDGTHSDMLGYEELLSKASDKEPKVKVSASDMDTMTYTSGTTGRPAGSLRKQEQGLNWVLTLFLTAFLTPDGLLGRPGLIPNMLGSLKGGAKLINFFPFYHWGGVTSRPIFALGTYYLGSNLAGDIKTVLETIEKDKIGMVAGVPTIITRVLEYPDVDKYDLSSIVFWLSSGAALADPVREKFRKFLPNALLYELYSSTEAIFSGGLLDSVAGKERSSGKKLAGVAVKILDAEGGEVPMGAWGQIYVKGAGLHEGYYKDEDRTKRSKMIIDGEEWFTSEDVGYMDKDGHLYVSDRAKDVINTGGELVYTLEVESMLLKHPKIAEVAVVGSPDPEYQERVTAVVVLKRGETATSEEIMDWCKDKVASFKRPRRVDFVDELPIVGPDKIDKKLIRDWYWKGEKFKV